MKYVLLIYGDERSWDTLSEPQQQQIIDETCRHVEELKSNGHFLSAAPLHPTSMTTCVRMHQGKRVVTDGPFAETKEQLGGFSLIEAKNLDEAIALS